MPSLITIIKEHTKIFRTLEQIVDRDKAGMIFSPQIGLHENVAVLDFNDEFANIIINENISYETLVKLNQTSQVQAYYHK